jgi:hypothetical protein
MLYFVLQACLICPMDQLISREITEEEKDFLRKFDESLEDIQRYCQSAKIRTDFSPEQCAFVRLADQLIQEIPHSGWMIAGLFGCYHNRIRFFDDGDGLCRSSQDHISSIYRSICFFVETANNIEQQGFLENRMHQKLVRLKMKAQRAVSRYCLE